MAVKKYIIWLLLVLSAITGCESLEDTYADYAGTTRYLGKCQNVNVAPGWKRLIVTWENHVDAVIENIKITWVLNNVKKEVVLEKGTTEYSISDLENGVYEISVYSMDKDGNTSLPEIRYERPYTSLHENVLSFTNLIDKSFFIGNRLAIIFSDWQEKVEKASLHYYSGGELKIQELDEEFVTKNKYFFAPHEIDPDTPVTIERSGYLTGCSDLIDFDPYTLSRNKLFTSEFKQLCEKNYGVNMLSEDFINSTEELHYDYDVTTFEDILNFPNLKKIVLGKHRYLGNEYLDTYKSASQVAEKERSEFAIRIAHEVLGITIDSYNEHYFPRETFDFVNYLGNTSLPDLSFLDAGNWTYTAEPLDGLEGLKNLFDAESTTGWVKAKMATSAAEYEFTIDMQEVKEINGLQISQYAVNPKSNTANTHHALYLAQKIEITAAEFENEWSNPFKTGNIKTLGYTSGETNIINFETTQRVRYLKFKVKQQRNSWYYGISLGKIRVF